jgi:hypothetical protein
MATSIRPEKKSVAPASQPSVPGRLHFIWQIVYVRLRFVIIIAAAFAVVANWDAIRTVWRKSTKQLPIARSVPLSDRLDVEFWCPMCPGVLSEMPAKCPVCNMRLVERKRGEAIPAPDGSLARMHQSPYRVQLAGMQTAMVEFRPLVHEIVSGGLVQAADVGGKTIVHAEINQRDSGHIRINDRVKATCDRLPRAHPMMGRVSDIQSGQLGRVTVAIEIDDNRLELRAGDYVGVRFATPISDKPWHRQAMTESWRDALTFELVGHALTEFPGRLSPFGMAAALGTANQLAMAQRGLVLSVADAAVIDTGRQQVVYREMGPGMFEATRVIAGPRCGEHRPILRGLEPGTRVATAGAFLLDAEARLNPAIAAAYFGAARPSASSGSSEIEQALSALAPEDRQLAVKQKLCPVTDEPLGSMGAPVRVVLQGRPVFLCCAGCETELRAKPDRYLAKLAP